MEGSWHFGCIPTSPRGGGFPIVTSEGGAHGRVALLPAGEVGLGKLRPLTADGSIDGDDDAAVGLLEVQRERVAAYQYAVALTVGQEGRVDAAVVAFEVEVVLVLRPKAVAVGLLAAGIAGKGTIAYPLHAVDAGVEQPGQS